MDTPLLSESSIEKENEMRKMSVVGVVVLALLLGAVQFVEAGVLPGSKKKAAAAAYTPPTDRWEPYFMDDKGRTYPLAYPVEQNKDKNWMFLTFTEYDGPRIRLAVMPVENSTGTGKIVAQAPGAVVAFSGLSQVPIGGIEDLLTTALLGTGRFDLVERKALGNVLAEQDLATEGRITKQTAAKTGNVLGAQYMIEASVNDWTPEKTKAGGGVGGLTRRTLGAVGGGKSKAEVAMSFRVIDAETSQVLFSTTERAVNKSWGIGLGFLTALPGPLKLLGALGGFEKNSPISYAVIACINKGVYKLALWLGEKRWSGQVVQVRDGKVYINAGVNSGLKLGMRMSVFSVGESLIDPATGISLGSESQRIGTLRLVDVKEKFSIAVVDEGGQGLDRGDRVELIE